MVKLGIARFILQSLYKIFVGHLKVRRDSAEVNVSEVEVVIGIRWVEFDGLFECCLRLSKFIFFCACLMINGKTFVLPVERQVLSVLLRVFFVELFRLLSDS